MSGRQETLVTEEQNRYENQRALSPNEYRESIQAQMDTESAQAIDQGEKRLEAVTQLGLPEEELASIKQSTNIDARLATNTAAIQTLTENMKGQLDLKPELQPAEAPAFVAEPEPQTVEQPEGVESIENREKIMEGYQEKRASLLARTLSGGADFIPFAGGVKMTAESLVGKTLAGEKMTGKERLIHGAVGAASFGLDFAGGAGVLAKGARLGGKSIGLIEKAGTKAGPKIARVCARTSAFMAKHPEMTKIAEEAVDKQIERAIKIPETYKINNFKEQQRAA